MRVHRIVPGIAATLAVTLLAACSGLPPEEGSARTEGDRIYRTGSNLPQRDRSINDVTIVDPNAMQNGITRSSGTMHKPGG